MALNRLAHYSVRTHDLAASKRFYTELLGLREGFRPPFRFPGTWLYLGDDESTFGVVHLIPVGAADAAVRDYLGERGEAPGAGALDHVAFFAHDWPAFRARCERLDVPYTRRVVPALGLFQVFLADPSGVTVELNFPADESDEECRDD